MWMIQNDSSSIRGAAGGQQGSVRQLIVDLILSFLGAPGEFDIQVEYHPKVSPHVEGGLAYV